MVTVTNLTVQIRTKELLHNVSCSLQPGHITSFLGPSGAGKTTLLKTIIGLIQPTTGSILIDKTDLFTLASSLKAEAIGYVFQDFNLFPRLTVLENCTAPLLLHNVQREVAEQKARTLLNRLRMERFLASYPHTLSGGQQQRVAIARALCLNPKVLLFDEPTASLDPHNTDILVTLLKELAAQGLTVGLSTQDMSFAQKIFDRTYFLTDGTVIENCEKKEQLSSCPQLSKFLQ